ncbi:NTP transferase domain-containing protein [Sulfuriroseicoccus oceanibius]|uniref:NTP transferase domain-containing protein n=1 Tax=Sulfuriroseicoccus oceanibius TaxID=2707525 RepID=A0A6B3L577_9BACT|nr:NTP transferase domain-containing protein [Sulfuriroseicoccus oceanibius]QQL44850.1 NTP transferase domain-containing protein [Sulfuriroseicoccus oceanibius]
MSAEPTVRGLLLAGGKSKRMGQDKAAMVFRDGLTQIELVSAILSKVGVPVHLSLRDGQESPVDGAAVVRDAFGDAGPLGALASAQQAHPDCAWLVVACDLPLLSETAVAQLLEERVPSAAVTFFASRFDGRPEPLCAIWEPSSAQAVRDEVDSQRLCARRLLESEGLVVKALAPRDPMALDNANTPEEAEEIARRVSAPLIEVRVRYFGVLGAETGRSEECVATRATTVGELFSERKAQLGLEQDASVIRAAIDDEFVAWDAPLVAGADVAFMPPFAGG